MPFAVETPLGHPCIRQANAESLPWAFHFVDAADLRAILMVPLEQMVRLPESKQRPCELDPFSIEGLRELGDADPANWRSRLQAAVSPERLAQIRAWRPTELDEERMDWSGSPSLRDLALAYIPALLAGDEAGLESVRKARQLLSHLPVDEIRPHHVLDQPLLLDVALVHGRGARLGRDAMRRARGLLGFALWQWAREIGSTFELEERDDLRARRRPRPTLLLKRVAGWFSQVDRIEALKLGLVLGCGLSGPEVDDLTDASFEHVAGGGSRAHVVFVRVAGKHPRLVPLPLWLVDLWLECVRAGDTLERAPRLESTIRRLRRQGNATDLTLSALRTTWQFVMRHRRVPRGAVRGTLAWASGDIEEALHDPTVQVLLAVALEWTQLAGGPAGGLWDNRGLVPARAPSRVSAKEPERRGRRRRRQPSQFYGPDCGA